MRNLFLFIVAAFASLSFAGNCGSDQFLTCNPANVASLAPISAVQDSNNIAVRTGNGNYNKASAFAWRTYMAAQLVTDTTFIDTVRGFSTKPVVTVTCQKAPSKGAGIFITCQVPSFTGTSNATTLTMDAFPAGWRPTTTTRVGGLAVTDNSVVSAAGSVSVATTGVPTFSTTDSNVVPTATFTNTGTKASALFVFSFLK